MNNDNIYQVEYNESFEALRRSKEMADALNKVASVFLTGDTGNDFSFDEMMTKGMGMIADMADLDRLNLWRNSMEEDGLHTSQIYRWDRASGGTTLPTAELINLSFSKLAPGWEEILVAGKSVNSPAGLLSEKDLLNSYGVMSVFITPIFIKDEFWGFVLFSDHRNERYFDDYSAEMLQSAAFLCANAVIRREWEDELFRANEINELQLTKLNLAIKAAKIGLWDMEIVYNDLLNNTNAISWSDEFRQMLGYNDENDFPNLISSFHNCLHPDDFERVTSAISNHIMDTTGKTPYNIEYRVIKKNGEIAYFKANSETFRDEKGRPLRVTGTAIDITEEKELLLNTEKLRDQAEEANKAKSVFLANMSHEIRTPLNAVIGLSDLILGSDDLDSENRYRLEHINNAGETLLGTVNDILDISKIESGKFELIPSRYDIPSMINDVVTQSILHRGDKPIEFELELCENLPTTLYGDELRIKQILTNLLSNAFKYTLQGTVELIVSNETDGDDVWLSFTIKDTGIGIRQEDMENLFTDYVQMDAATNRKVVGTGLGLSIAKRLSILMNGEIIAKSEYGIGSSFSVRLLQKRVSDDLIDQDVIESLKHLSYSEQRRRLTGTFSRISLPYARVLIVDDVVTNLDVAKGLMKPYHMQVDCVTGGFDAVEAMHDERVRYNAIFMDHMMPGMDGIEATRLIREIGNDYAKNIPIIALTANAIVGNEEMFLSNGFQAFISKPIEIKRLDSVIREWVRDKEQEKLYSREELDDKPLSEQADMITRELLKKTVPGISIEKGLIRFDNDGEAYLEILGSFARNTPPLLETARMECTDKNSLNYYETVVHGIKGSSRAIFADEIGDMSEALEEAAGAGDFTFIASKNAEFITATEILISNIKQLVNDIQSINPKQLKEKPDEEVLNKLHEACINYDITLADTFITDLEAYDYKSNGELIIWLRENIEQANFDEIVERLEGNKDEQ